jgi:hypothetical protein
MSDKPLILPRPKNQGPIPVPAITRNNQDIIYTISETELKRLKWIAFNEGYNEGYTRGFKSAGKKIKKNN